MKTILIALRILLVFTILTGAFYPVLVTAIGSSLFTSKAGGSLITTDGKVTGSWLLAQKTENPRYFWPRASASDHTTIPSGASNKGPTSKGLVKAVAERRVKFGADAPDELLTASGSGLDPHISPEAARHQAQRIANARGASLETINALIAAKTELPQFGVLGEPRINVLALNLVLDKQP